MQGFQDLHGFSKEKNDPNGISTILMTTYPYHRQIFVLKMKDGVYLIKMKLPYRLASGPCWMVTDCNLDVLSVRI